MNPNLYWLWLCSLPGIGGVTVSRLLRYFPSPEVIYTAGEEELLGCEGLRKRELVQLCNKDLSRAELIREQCGRLHIQIITMDDPGYPARLGTIHDPPGVLYVRGRLPKAMDELCIAVVGSRDCDERGCSVAKKIAYDLASRGATVVSGMARGIDGMAHRGAIQAGGQTVAVLGCGVDRAYPAEHERMMDYIIANGAVVSEYPPGTAPLPSFFPQRNRIISGLSQGIVVVQAGEHSGSLITANLAAEQGRDVFAVPGAPDDLFSIGCNQLIRDGARLITSAGDVLEEYESLYPGMVWKKPRVRPPCRPASERAVKAVKKKPEGFQVPADVSPLEGLLLLELVRENLGLEQLCARLHEPPGAVSAALVMLEIQGHLRQIPGGQYQLSKQ